MPRQKVVRLEEVCVLRSPVQRPVGVPLVVDIVVPRAAAHTQYVGHLDSMTIDIAWLPRLADGDLLGRKHGRQSNFCLSCRYSSYCGSVLRLNSFSNRCHAVGTLLVRPAR